MSENLAALSVQHDLYPTELFEALVTARSKGKAKAQNLTIEYRGSFENEAIFLVKQGDNVIVQFRVEEDTLKEGSISFENWMDDTKVRRHMSRQAASEPASFTIKDLRQGMKKVNLTAKVVKMEKPRMVHTQFGNNALLANAIVEDETDKIKLCLWDQQVSSVAVGDTIQINNASVSTFKGEKQLRLGKAGTVSVISRERAPRAETSPKSNAKRAAIPAVA